MPILRLPGRDTPEKKEYVLGFQKGVNKLQDESLIDDHELSLSINSKLVVDGVKKRDGTINIGSSSGSRVFGGSPFYTSATSNNRWMIREGGTSLQYYNGSNVPTNISGATMTADSRTNFAMARDTLYVVNGVDNLVKIAISGGVPVATTFTAITTPTGLAVAAQGTTGSTTYSYRVSAINAVGETLAAASVEITDGNATLDSTNFNRVTWNSVTNATGYNIYGRKPSSHNGIGETLMASVGTGVTTYDDKATDDPSATVTPPEGNTTSGVIGSMVIYALSRLFIAGDPNNPSRLYYSAGATQIEDFSSAYGGGWIDINKNDGDKITGIYFYQNAIIVWKKRSVWKFDFTDSGLPRLQLITNEVGCESFRTIQIVNNDLWFEAKKDGQVKVFSLGNVKNYFNALRTTEQSLKISTGSHLDSANLAQTENACATYFRNLYIFSVADGSSTVNDRHYVYDSRFGSWVGYWTGFSVNSFFSYTDSNGSEDLYACDDESGYIYKLFTGTDDNGTAIDWKIQTKNFNQKRFDEYKIYRNPIFWFKDVSGGSITGYVITDGIFSSGNFNISPPASGIGAGYDLAGTFLAGDSEGAATNSANSDQPTELIYSINARSIKFELDDNNASSDFKFLGFSYKWLLLEGKPLPADNRIRIS